MNKEELEDKIKEILEIFENGNLNSGAWILTPTAKNIIQRILDQLPNEEAAFNAGRAGAEKPSKYDDRYFNVHYDYPTYEAYKKDKSLAITTRLAALDDGSGWVSVNERLPKKNEEYIVCGTGFEGKIVTTLEWKKGKWFSDVYQKYIEQIKITHWQPLPKSPNNDN